MECFATSLNTEIQSRHALCEPRASIAYIHHAVQRDEAADGLAVNLGFHVGVFPAAAVLVLHQEGHLRSGGQGGDRGLVAQRVVRQFAAGGDLGGIVAEIKLGEVVHQALKLAHAHVAHAPAALVQVIGDQGPVALPAGGVHRAVGVAHGLPVRPAPGKGVGGGIDRQLQVPVDADLAEAVVVQGRLGIAARTVAALLGRLFAAGVGGALALHFRPDRFDQVDVVPLQAGEAGVHVLIVLGRDRMIPGLGGKVPAVGAVGVKDKPVPGQDFVEHESEGLVGPVPAFLPGHLPGAGIRHQVVVPQRGRGKDGGTQGRQTEQQGDQFFGHGNTSLSSHGLIRRKKLLVSSPYSNIFKAFFLRPFQRIAAFRCGDDYVTIFESIGCYK